MRRSSESRWHEDKCRTNEASVASDADWVEKDQMCGEKPVSVIGSPMCQTFCGVIMKMTRAANRVSEVKCKNLGEQCVRTS